MTYAIDDLASAIAGIKRLGAKQTLDIGTLTHIEQRYAEEHARQHICHMVAHHLTDDIQEFQEHIISSKYVGGPDAQIELTADLYVITPVDYKRLVAAVRHADRFIQSMQQANLLNASVK